MEQLQQLVDRMESGESGLKESLDDYRRGAALVKHCRALLKDADEEIGRLSAGDR
jgi:exodeoxyribonuclease VII small subunit